MQIARFEVQSLSRFEHDVVEQQRGRNARLARVPDRQRPHPFRLRPIVGLATIDNRKRINRASVQTFERRTRAFALHDSGDLTFIESELVEQVDRRVDGTQTAQRLERGQGTQQFGFGVCVRVDPPGETVCRLRQVRMSLQ